MINLFKKNIHEIQDSFNLSLYGLFLSLTHLFTFFYWNNNHFFINSQTHLNAEPICFPFFPNCDLWRSLIGSTGWTCVLYFYLILTLVSCFLFFERKRINLAYYSLLFLTIFKATLHFSNYNFMGNYHYMVYFVTFVFLFFPQKSKLIQIMIVAFYFSAGLLKLNIDWLSGAAMISTPLLHGSLLLIALYYVVFLELLFSLTLLCKNQWIRIFFLLQFLAFHIFSWHIVGFYYPLVMFSLLSLFVLEEISIMRKQKENSNLLSAFSRFKLPPSHYYFLFFFLILQVFPFLTSIDPSFTGVARLPSLNMFDSKTECQSLLIAHRKKDSIHIDRPLKALGVRLQCDPLVFLNQAYQLCRENLNSQEFDRLSLSLLSKRVTQTSYTKVLDFKDICRLKNILWAELTPEDGIL